MDFEWDPAKATANLAKHKISFEDAATVFADPLGWIVADPRHSILEQRFALLGLSSGRRSLAVMFVEREHTIRIISARRASEQRNYEENAH